MNRNVKAEKLTEKDYHPDGSILSKTAETLAKKNLFNYCEVCKIKEIEIVNGNVQQVAWCECEDDRFVFTFAPKIECVHADIF